MTENITTNITTVSATGASTYPIQERCVLVTHLFTAWSGGKVVQNTDHRDETGALKEEQARARKGSKWLVNPRSLNNFSRIKREFLRLVARFGVSIPAGQIVPSEKFAQIEGELDRLVQEYESEKLAFCSNYEAEVQKWAQDNPALTKSIINAAPTKAYVEGAISAGYLVTPLTAGIGRQTADERERLLCKQVRPALAHEVAEAAREFSRARMATAKRNGTIENLNSIFVLAAKVESMVCAAPGAAALAAAIRKEAGRFQKKTGYKSLSLELGEFRRLQALINSLSNEQLVSEILNGSRDADRELCSTVDHCGGYVIPGEAAAPAPAEPAPAVESTTEEAVDLMAEQGEAAAAEPAPADSEGEELPPPPKEIDISEPEPEPAAEQPSEQPTDPFAGFSGFAW